MTPFLTDLRQSCRSLLKSPGFTIPLLLVLSLGLGTSVAIHGMLQRLLLRPLPIPQPEDVFVIARESNVDTSIFGSYREYKDLSAALPDVPMAATKSLSLVLPELKARSLRNGQFVSESFFPMLGLKAHLGDLSLQGDDASLVISHDLWQEAFQGDPTILGRLIRIQNHACRVVGIAPKGFSGLTVGSSTDLWLPLNSLSRFESHAENPEQLLKNRFSEIISVYARIPAPRQSRFNTDLSAVIGQMPSLRPEERKQVHKALPLKDLRQRLVKDFLPDQGMVFGATLLGLLLTSVGAASLMGARLQRKSQEILLRRALGAGNQALARTLLMENLLLACIALPLAVGTGWLLGKHLLALPQNVHIETSPMTMDLGGLVIPACAGLLCLVMGVSIAFPLRQCLRMDLAETLKLDSFQGGRRAGNHWLVSCQVALSLALLAASSVALNAMHKGAQVGYNLEHKAYIQFYPRLAGQAEDEGLANRMLEAAKNLPGIKSAALGAAAPLDGMNIEFSLRDPSVALRSFPVSFVGSSWFETLGVQILEGREFRESDPQTAAILSQSMAKKIWPQATAFTGLTIPGSGFKVVGVVADHRQRVDKEIQQPMVFLTRGFWGTGQSTLLVQTQGSANPMPQMLRQILMKQAPELPPLRAYTLDDQLDLVLRQERQNLRLLGLLGLGSLTLACFSLWAALNLQVALRRRELGIRAALGASLSQLMNTVLTRGARLLALGLAGGLTLTWVMVKLGRWQWPRMPELSPWNLATAALTLMAAGLLACLIPALKAARVDPAEALRED